MHAETAHKDYLDARQNLMDIENEIEKINRKIDSVDLTSDDYIKLELKKERLSDKKQKLQRQYEEKRYEDQKTIGIVKKEIALLQMNAFLR